MIPVIQRAPLRMTEGLDLFFIRIHGSACGLSCIGS